MRFLVAIPTYNEIENLKPLIEAVLSVSTENVNILIVDDNSPDGTGKLADELARQDQAQRIHVLHRTGKLGLGSAYVRAFKWGLEKGYDAIIEMDADFSHHPKYLPIMFSLLKQNPVVIGSRYIADGGTLNWGMGRKVLSRGGSIYSRMILGAPIRDFTGGFNGWQRKVLETIDLDGIRSDGYSFQIELKYRAFRAGFELREFPIIFEDRKVGKSKMNKKIVLEALGRVWWMRWSALTPPGSKP